MPETPHSICRIKQCQSLLLPRSQAEPGAIIGAHVTIGPFCIIAAGVEIGDRSRIGKNATIHRGTVQICFNSTEKLDKEKIYICYCDGIGCNASTKTAMKLMTLGFKVKELLGGLDWWKRDGYSTEGVEGKEGTPIFCGC